MKRLLPYVIAGVFILGVLVFISVKKNTNLIMPDSKDLPYKSRDE